MRPFAGTVLQLSVTGAPVSQPGQHYELWARTQYDDIVRIDAIYDTKDSTGKALHSFYGYSVRLAITMGDPCMIDDKGNLLITPAAYPKTVTINGVKQTPEEQAAQVRARIAQLTAASLCDGATPPHCGGQANGSLYGVVPFNPVPEPDAYKALTYDTPADVRLAACQEYWNSSPLAYTPNPAQLTAPAHGTVYGFLAFQSTNPPAAYDGFRLNSPVNLKGIQELFFTVEPDTVDPKNRGPVLIQGTPTPGGIEVVHIDLTTPAGASVLGVSGTAALFVDLDQDPVQF